MLSNSAASELAKTARVQTVVTDPVELDLLRMIRELQVLSTEILADYRRRLAENKTLPKASPDQRAVALGHLTILQLLGSVDEASPATAARYLTRGASALASARKKGLELWEHVDQHSGNLQSWYAFKAGVQHYLEVETVRLKRALDKWQGDRQLGGRSAQALAAGKDIVVELMEKVSLLAKTPTDPPERLKGDGKSKQYAANSKSKSIRGIESNWREKCALGLTGSFRLLFLMHCVTGCRPKELENGVQVRLRRDGSLVTRVRGAKLTNVAGQPARGMKLRANSGIAKMLADCLTVGVTLSSRNFGLGAVNSYAKRVARACAQAYPERTGGEKLSAYSLRHQFKADLIAACLSKAQIARAMGHRTERSGTAYGQGGRGGGGGVKPIAVKATRAVKARSPHPGAKKNGASNVKSGAHSSARQAYQPNTSSPSATRKNKPRR